mgnify:CR=1 FL=1
MMDARGDDTTNRMEDIFEHRNREYAGGVLTSGLRRAADSWRYQALALIPAILATTPALLASGLCLAVVAVATGTTPWGGLLVVIPYGVVLAFITVGAGATFRDNTIDWSEFDLQVSGGDAHRTQGATGQDYARLAVLCLTATNFLAGIALVVGIGAWAVVGTFATGGGVIAAVAGVGLTFGFEIYQIRRNRRALLSTGVGIGAMAYRKYGNLSAHDRAGLDDITTTAEFIIANTVSTHPDLL